MALDMLFLPPALSLSSILLPPVQQEVVSPSEVGWLTTPLPSGKLP